VRGRFGNFRYTIQASFTIKYVSSHDFTTRWKLMKHTQDKLNRDGAAK